MGTYKICDYLCETGDPKPLACPRCKGREFEVMTVKERGKRRTIAVKLRCLTAKCREFDVMGGFITMR